MPIVTVSSPSALAAQTALSCPYDVPAAKAYVTPPDPRVQAKIPAIYIWPSRRHGEPLHRTRRHHPPQHRAEHPVRH